jgi:hypothetical protein
MILLVTAFNTLEDSHFVIMSELVFTNNRIPAVTSNLIGPTMMKCKSASNVIGYKLNLLELNTTRIVAGRPSTEFMIRNKLEGR